MYQNVSHKFGDGFTGYSDSYTGTSKDDGYTFKKFIKEYGPVNSCHRCVIIVVHKNGYDVKFECDDYPFVKCYMSKIESVVSWKVGEIINLKIIDILTDINNNKHQVKTVFLSLKQNNSQCLTGKMREIIKKRRV